MANHCFKLRCRIVTPISIAIGLLFAMSANCVPTVRGAVSRPTTATRQPFRILCVGDSLTQVQFSQGTIKDLGWNHTAGMAASSASKDYAHRLASYIQKALPNRKVVLNITAPNYWGKLHDDTTCTLHAYLHTYLAPLKAFIKRHPIASYNLIVLQHGEHELSARGVPFMRGTCQAWMKLFARGHHPIIICTGDWSPDGQKYLGWPKQVDHTMRRICQKWGGHFVSMEAVAVDPRNRGWGPSQPLQWHPNDRGHELYAIRIFRKFQQVAVKQGLKLRPVTLPQLKP